MPWTQTSGAPQAPSPCFLAAHQRCTADKPASAHIESWCMSAAVECKCSKCNTAGAQLVPTRCKKFEVLEECYWIWIRIEYRVILFDIKSFKYSHTPTVNRILQYKCTQGMPSFMTLWLIPFSDALHRDKAVPTLGVNAYTRPIWATQQTASLNLFYKVLLQESSPLKCHSC